MSTAIVLLLWILMLPQFTFAQADERTGLRTAADFVAIGDRYFAQGDYRTAATQYQNAILLDSKFEPACAKLGFTYLKLGNWNLAYRQLTLATADDPDDLEAQLTLGKLLLAARQIHRALHIANTVLAKDPKNVQARMLRIAIERMTENLQADGTVHRPAN